MPCISIANEQEEMMKITKIWFENNRLYGLADDGRILWQSLLYCLLTI